MVLALVMLPIIADIQFGEQTLSWQSIALDLGWTLGKVSLFVALMMVVGSRFIPGCWPTPPAPARVSCSPWRC